MAALGEDLLHIVNKLQDLVFNTIGNDSLDLPQIVSRSRFYCLTPLLTIIRWWLARNHLANPPSSKTLSAEIFFRAEAAL